MEPSVKRSYTSAKRAAQAVETKRSVVAAARDLFVTQGYAATTIRGIADTAGVAVQTVYQVFGTKTELLRQVIESAIGGEAGESDSTVRQSEQFAALATEPDPMRRAKMDAALTRAIGKRVAPVVRVAQEAAASDPEISALLEAVKARRRQEMLAMTQLLAGPSELRIDTEQAAATLYVLYSPHVLDMLMGDYGWTEEQYERWIAYMLYRTLLEPPAGQPTPTE